MPTHYQGPLPEVRALNCYIKLTRASERLAAALRGPLSREGLTTGQLGVLEALLHIGPMKERELGRKLLRSGGNVTVVVDNLERRGLVRRARNPEDRRCVIVTLTPEGERLIQRVFPGHAARITAAMSVLSRWEQDELGRLCRKLGRGVEERSALAEPISTLENQ
ncbi:MarR family winged helix-turn-helix transcriptional regulator [Methylacidimicrobium sp. B4]|uniref:MarR family winged helix-turn-helix transcriptional regulator n=1 Tax=Methylacidimicrobium sp. B4 TaxID=2796139 RepID=UPI001A8CEB92|nr:MarR family transcriptional regulator [Methylacidimicrobium sp. B4]QSR85265.1 MarR family transcriptional regulator [Methylacidimicrobium sp. B4]